MQVDDDALTQAIPGARREDLAKPGAELSREDWVDEARHAAEERLRAVAAAGSPASAEVSSDRDRDQALLRQALDVLAAASPSRNSTADDPVIASSAAAVAATNPVIASSAAAVAATALPISAAAGSLNPSVSGTASKPSSATQPFRSPPESSVPDNADENSVMDLFDGIVRSATGRAAAPPGPLSPSPEASSSSSQPFGPAPPPPRPKKQKTPKQDDGVITARSTGSESRSGSGSASFASDQTIDPQGGLRSPQIPPFTAPQTAPPSGSPQTSHSSSARDRLAVSLGAILGGGASPLAAAQGMANPKDEEDMFEAAAAAFEALLHGGGDPEVAISGGGGVGDDGDASVGSRDPLLGGAGSDDAVASTSSWEDSLMVDAEIVELGPVSDGGGPEIHLPNNHHSDGSLRAGPLEETEMGVTTSGASPPATLPATSATSRDHHQPPREVPPRSISFRGMGGRAVVAALSRALEEGSEVVANVTGQSEDGDIVLAAAEALASILESNIGVGADIIPTAAANASARSTLDADNSLEFLPDLIQLLPGLYRDLLPMVLLPSTSSAEGATGPSSGSGSGSSLGSGVAERLMKAIVAAISKDGPPSAPLPLSSTSLLPLLHVAALVQRDRSLLTAAPQQDVGQPSPSPSPPLFSEEALLSLQNRVESRRSPSDSSAMLDGTSRASGYDDPSMSLLLLFGLGLPLSLPEVQQAAASVISATAAHALSHTTAPLGSYQHKERTFLDPLEIAVSLACLLDCNVQRYGGSEAARKPGGATPTSALQPAGGSRRRKGGSGVPDQRLLEKQLRAQVASLVRGLLEAALRSTGPTDLRPPHLADAIALSLGIPDLDIDLMGALEAIRPGLPLIGGARLAELTRALLMSSERQLRGPKQSPAYTGNSVSSVTAFSQPWTGSFCAALAAPGASAPTSLRSSSKNLSFVSQFGVMSLPQMLDTLRFICEARRTSKPAPTPTASSAATHLPFLASSAASAIALQLHQLVDKAEAGAPPVASSPAGPSRSPQVTPLMRASTADPKTPLVVLELLEILTLRSGSSDSNGTCTSEASRSSRSPFGDVRLHPDPSQHLAEAVSSSGLVPALAALSAKQLPPSRRYVR